MSGKRRPDIRVGDRFDKLTVLGFERRGTNSIVVCQCDCGKRAVPSSTVLRNRIQHACGSCAIRRGWQKIIRLPLDEIEFRMSIKNYRNGAKKRGLVWNLPDWLFRSLYNRACFYCGLSSARGVDRHDNAKGYTRENSVPCCAQCNYAKRDQTELEFLQWLRRLVEHQGAPQK